MEDETSVTKLRTYQAYDDTRRLDSRGGFGGGGRPR